MNVELFVTKELRETPLEGMDFSNRSRNALMRMECKTIGDVIDQWNRLPRIRGLGSGSIKEIKNAVVEESLEYLSDRQIRDFYYGLLINNSAEELKPFLDRLIELEEQIEGKTVKKMSKSKKSSKKIGK